MVENKCIGWPLLIPSKPMTNAQSTVRRRQEVNQRKQLAVGEKITIGK